MDNSRDIAAKAPWKHKLLWIAWAFCFALSILFVLIFAQGVIRDMRVGEPVLRVDLSSRSDWVSRQFRILRPGTYNLFISTVNHDERFVGEPLAGAFEVAVIAPDGKEFFQRHFSGDTTDHVLPRNYGDSKLATLELDSSLRSRWTLKARVLDADPKFSTAFTDIKLWKVRSDPGMGGLINYVMIIPAGIFMLVAFVASLVLAKQGARSALMVTLIGGVACFVLLTII